MNTDSTIPGTGTSGQLVQAIADAEKAAAASGMPDVARELAKVRHRVNASAFAKYRDEAQRAEWALRRPHGSG